MCTYGSGCRRKGCIYRHPPKTKTSISDVTKDPRTCKFFLMGQCTFGSGCRYTHPKDVVPPKPAQCSPVLEEYVEEDPRVSEILKKASLTEFEKQRQIREIQRQGKTETTSSTTSKMSASSQSWTPSSSSQPYVPLNLTSSTTTTTIVKPDFVLTSVPKDVSSVLPESLTRRVQFVTNEICKNVQILDSEDDTLGLDDVISILLPLEEVSLLLRDQEPVNGKTITYTTVLWCVRKCLGMVITKLRDERKVDDEDLKLLERSIRFASPISDEAPMLCVSESSDSRSSFMSVESYGLASHLRLVSLQQSFPHVPRSVVASMFDKHRGDMSATVKELVNSFGAPLSSTKKKESGSVIKNTNTTTNRESVPTLTTQKRVVSSNLTWVDSGSSVSSTYTKDGLRKKAAEHAKLRNKFFQQATEAYLRGDGALAKQLSQKGRSHDVEMKRLHTVASERIHRERQNFTGNDATVLDLHGQHISEAISRAEAFLQHHHRAGITREVTIIAGAGKHSIATHARSLGRRSLREALRGWLERTQGRGRFYELKGDAIGSFVVSV